MNKKIESKIKEITSINNKIKKLIDQSRINHEQLTNIQEDILHNTELLTNLSSNSDIDIQDKKAIDKHLAQIKDLLRQIQFIDEMEFRSEQLISKIDKKHVSKKSPADIDTEWEKMFKLLESYMKEYRHCYFEPPKKNKNGKPVYSLYKGVKLGKWVEEQRNELATIKLDDKEAMIKFKKRGILSGIAIKDDTRIVYARDHVQLIDKMNIEEPDFFLDATEDFILSEKKDGTFIFNKLNKENSRFTTADYADRNLNHVYFQWTNADASWMRYFKELKKYYVKNLHCMVEAKEKSNDLELGTWVLRLRREWKKDTNRHVHYGEREFDEFETYLNRDYLLYNLFFIFQTSLGAAMNNRHARQDVLDLCERIDVSKEIDLFRTDSGDKK